MTLKSKISIFVTGLFVLLYAVMATLVLILFSQFRSEEFQDRLRQKATATIELLIELKQSDQEIIKNIDKQKADNLIDEKTLVYNNNLSLVYSSLYDTALAWEKQQLPILQNNHEFFQRKDSLETFGIKYNYKKEDYYVIVSAKDISGFRKLNYLKYVLLFSFILFALLAWLSTRLMVSKLLKPLDHFHKKIKLINENNLDEVIEVKSENNEIDLLAYEFNLMLQRIDASLKHQSEFTANASHELRTPISRIIAQIENKMNDEGVGENTKAFLQNILDDTNQISELIHSLLILSKNNTTISNLEQLNRLDEIIYDCISKMNMLYPDCKVYFDIVLEKDTDDIVELRASKTLLEIVFINLIKNAYAYSDNKEVHIKILQKQHELQCIIMNTGNTISENDQKRLYEPFMRGENSQGKPGFGIGLRIVERILNVYKAKISYTAVDKHTNEFLVQFPV
jgi:two-component system sensor histidine kinase ArlS